MNIQVEIGRLVLEGIDISPHQRPILQAAVEAELGRLLATGGLTSGLASGGAVPHVPTQAIQLTGNNAPGDLGQQIAQTVYREIGR
ncbi:MAG: hypothetical protein HC877_18700 [Thioploca sp.]|nr:hypothetical protein [Thioploca sp.]